MTTRLKTQSENEIEFPSNERLTSKKFNSQSKQIEQTHGYLNRAAKSLKELQQQGQYVLQKLTANDTVNV